MHIFRLIFEEALEWRKGNSLKVNFFVKKWKQFDYGVHLLQLRLLLLFVMFYVCNDGLSGSCCCLFMHNFVLLLKLRKYKKFPPYSLDLVFYWSRLPIWKIIAYDKYKISNKKDTWSVENAQNLFDASSVITMMSTSLRTRILVLCCQ